MGKEDIRKANSTLNHLEFEQKKIRLESRPRMLFLELTRSCNLMCDMCRGKLLKGSHLDMPADVLDRVDRELFPYVECVDVRGWGESTLDDRLLTLVDTLNERQVRVNLFTNLTTRSPGYWQEMGKREINIAISLEAGTRETYGKYRKGGRYDTFVSNLDALTGERQKRGIETDLYFTVVVSDENLPELPGIVQLASRCGIPLIRLNAITKDQTEGNYPQIGVGRDNKKVLDNVMEEVRGLSKLSGIRIQYSTNLIMTDDAGFDLCIHPWSYVFVRHDGAVGFCDHLVAHPGSIIGNLMEETFMEIWNSEEYLEIRREHLRGEFARWHEKGIECDWCYKNRFADCEYLFEPNYTPFELG